MPCPLVTLPVAGNKKGAPPAVRPSSPAKPSIVALIVLIVVSGQSSRRDKRSCCRQRISIYRRCPHQHNRSYARQWHRQLRMNFCIAVCGQIRGTAGCHHRIGTNHARRHTRDRSCRVVRTRQHQPSDIDVQSATVGQHGDAAPHDPRCASACHTSDCRAWIRSDYRRDENQLIRRCSNRKHSCHKTHCQSQ